MAKKSLGQHWLFDKPSLTAMIESANVRPGDTVLEIGPGLGTLTHELLDAGAHVIAVELDQELADDLIDKFADKNFTLHLGSILEFDLSTLPAGYKVVANIPYYLTSHLLRLLSESPNHPSVAALLVQKEVAERVTAIPGEHTIISISTQVYANALLGPIIPAALFSPPPKVDSRILILEYYDKPLTSDINGFFRVMKAGFSQPRKKLRSSLAGGLGIPNAAADELLQKAGIDANRRAQTLSIEEWNQLNNAVTS